MSEASSSPSGYVVSAGKITSYLLDLAHVDGGSKAKFFFLGHGFSEGRPDVLAAALLAHPSGGGLTTTIATRFGIKYICEGPISTPNGTTPHIRTVWQIDAGSAGPARLITAVPL